MVSELGKPASRLAMAKPVLAVPSRAVGCVWKPNWPEIEVRRMSRLLERRTSPPNFTM